MNLAKKKRDVERAATGDIAAKVRYPGPAPEWSGKRPGEHPLLPLKPPGVTR